MHTRIGIVCLSLLAALGCEKRRQLSDQPGSPGQRKQLAEGEASLRLNIEVFRPQLQPPLFDDPTASHEVPTEDWDLVLVPDEPTSLDLTLAQDLDGEPAQVSPSFAPPVGTSFARFSAGRLVSTEGQQYFRSTCVSFGLIQADGSDILIVSTTYRRPETHLFQISEKVLVLSSGRLCTDAEGRPTYLSNDSTINPHPETLVHLLRVMGAAEFRLDPDGLQMAGFLSPFKRKKPKKPNSPQGTAADVAPSSSRSLPKLEKSLRPADSPAAPSAALLDWISTNDSLMLVKPGTEGTEVSPSSFAYVPSTTIDHSVLERLALEQDWSETGHSVRGHHTRSLGDGYKMEIKKLVPGSYGTVIEITIHRRKGKETFKYVAKKVTHDHKELSPEKNAARNRNLLVRELAAADAVRGIEGVLVAQAMIQRRDGGIWQVMDAADGNLMTLRTSIGPPQYLQLIKTLREVHKRGWVHRDIKPENILRVEKNKKIDLFLADFGLANRLPGKLLENFLSAARMEDPSTILTTNLPETLTKRKLTSVIKYALSISESLGTRDYMPPFIKKPKIKGKSSYEVVDVEFQAIQAELSEVLKRLEDEALVVGTDAYTELARETAIQLKKMDVILEARDIHGFIKTIEVQDQPVMGVEYVRAKGHTFEKLKDKWKSIPKSYRDVPTTDNLQKLLEGLAKP